MRNPLSPTTPQAGLMHYFVRHRTAANLLMLALILCGLASGTRLRTQFFPDIVIETIFVNVAWPGAGAEDVDTGIVSVLEPSLMTISGVDNVSSTASEGRARITLEFEPGWDMGRASDDVKAAVDSASNLPEDAEEPEVRRSEFRDRVTDIVLSGPVGIELLDAYARELEDRLFAAGVSRLDIQGVADPVIRVEVDEAVLEEQGMTLRQIADGIGRAAQGVPAGTIDQMGVRLRVGEERNTPESVAGIPIKARADGSKLLLQDIARVKEEGLDRKTAFFVEGSPAVILRVMRSAGGDAIGIQELVEAEVAALQPTLPEGVDVRLYKTRSQAIKDRLGMLIRNGAQGLVLVLIMLFLFLSARTAFWVAAGIPTAMMATLLLMYLTGITINMISLFALIITLGIIVDDAIVVGEHADHLGRRGMSPAEAARRAAVRMAPPVFSASITTILAFGALVALGGRMGDLVADLPRVVVAVLIASLIESFLILPAHMKYALSAKQRRPWYDWPSRQFDKGFRFVRERFFRPLVRLVVILRYPVIGGVIMLFLLSVTAIVERTVPFRFFAPPERGVVRANIVMLTGATREDTLAQINELDRALGVVAAQYEAEYGMRPVEISVAKLGGTLGRGLQAAENKDADQLGAYEIEMIDPDLRPFSQRAFMRDWRGEVKEHPMLEQLALRGDRSGPAGDGVSVRFSGADSATLKAAAETLKRELSAFPQVSALEDTLQYDKTELIIRLSARAEALGLSISEVARELRDRLEGVEAAEFARGGRTVTIKVASPDSELSGDYLSRARIATPQGVIALSELVTYEPLEGFATVRREDGQRIVSVTGELTDNPAEQTEVREAMDGRILPDIAARFGVRFELTGAREDERRFNREAKFGSALALIGIYFTLAWIFASWTRPLIVMVVIPLGLIGAVWGHYANNFLTMGQHEVVPLSMFSIVGLIGMSGIIINDSIVLITTIDEYAQGRGLIPSVIDGTVDRLRAVMLTTLTTVLGLAPLLFEMSVQAQFIKPTVITLAYGLAFGMVLVLMVTPALLVVRHDIAMALRSLRRMLRRLRSLVLAER